MRAGLIAVPVSFKFPRETIHFILSDAGAKLVFCDLPRRADCPPGLSVVCFGSEDSERFDAFLDPGPFEPHRAGRARAGDVPLHVGLDRNTEGRRALAPEPPLGGGDAARTRARPPPLSDRGAALSHECAGASQARLRGARHHRAAAAVHRPRLYRGDRTLPLQLAHRGAADDRHDAARAGRARRRRSVERRVHPHGLGAGEPEPDAGDPRRVAARVGDQRLRHHRGRAGGVRPASEGVAAAGHVGRLPASAGRAASGRRRQPRRRAGERSERPARPLYKCARRTLA